MSQSIFALDIGTSVVKLGEFSSGKNGLVLENYSLVPVDVAPGEESLDHTLNAVEVAMDELGIKKESVLLSISSQNVLARYVKIPYQEDDKEREDMVRYEADDSIPLPMEEVAWDYAQLGEINDDEEMVDTLILAIKEDLIQDMTEELESIGLKTVLVDVAPMAIFNAVQYTYGAMDGCTLVVDMGARSTNLIFIENGKPFTRTITAVAGNGMTSQIAKEMDLDFGEADSLKKEKGFVALGGAYADPDDEEAKIASKVLRTSMTKLHSEINRAINLYRGQRSGRRPDRVLVTGGASAMPYTTNFLEEKLGVDVEFVNPLAEVELGKDVEAEEAEADFRSMSELVGLALREEIGADIELDLMPKTIIERKERARKQGWLVGALALLLGSAALWTFYYSHMVSKGKKSIQLVENKSTRLSNFQKTINDTTNATVEVKDLIDTLSSVPGGRDRMIRIFDTVSSKVPAGMWLYSLTPVVDAIVEDTPEGASAPAPGGGSAIFGAPAFQQGGKRGLTGVRLTGFAYQNVVKERRRMNEEGLLNDEPTDHRALMKEILMLKDPVTQKRLFVGQDPVNAITPPVPVRAPNQPIVEVPAPPYEFAGTFMLAEPIVFEPGTKEDMK